MVAFKNFPLRNPDGFKEKGKTRILGGRPCLVRFEGQIQGSLHGGEFRRETMEKGQGPLHPQVHSLGVDHLLSETSLGLVRDAKGMPNMVAAHHPRIDQKMLSNS